MSTAMERAMMRTAAVNDVTLEYEDRGAGAPVVLIHAAPLADFFAPLMDQPALGAYRLVRYHRRGYAGSGRMAGPVSISDQAADLAGLLGHLDIEMAQYRGSLDRGRDRASARSGPPRPRGASSDTHAADAHQLRRVDGVSLAVVAKARPSERFVARSRRPAHNHEDHVENDECDRDCVRHGRLGKQRSELVRRPEREVGCEHCGLD